ncbi:MAG: hypothetical protein MJ216_02005 [Bacilli bacterium]|nr:hypothetical protein [Bacilli bacterium]
MVEELQEVEKQERRARLKTRMLWIVVAIDILLFGYAVYEIIALILAK